jgi:hypothetical protein
MDRVSNIAEVRIADPGATGQVPGEDDQSGNGVMRRRTSPGNNPAFIGAP